MLEQPKLVPLFDIDLTLVRAGSRGDSDLYNFAFRQVYGVDASLFEVNPHGMTAAQIIFEVLKLHSLSEDNILARMPAAVEAMIGHFIAHEPEIELIAMPGARELLTTLEKDEIISGLLTGNVEGIAWRKLKKVGLAHFFEFGGFGDKSVRRLDLLEFAKQSARERLGLDLSISNFVIIGDSPLDIATAKAGGIRSIGVGAGLYTTSHLKEAGADLVVDSLQEQQAILNFLKNS